MLQLCNIIPILTLDELRRIILIMRGRWRPEDCPEHQSDNEDTRMKFSPSAYSLASISMSKAAKKTTNKVWGLSAQQYGFKPRKEAMVLTSEVINEPRFKRPYCTDLPTGDQALERFEKLRRSGSYPDYYTGGYIPSKHRPERDPLWLRLSDRTRQEIVRRKLMRKDRKWFFDHHHDLAYNDDRWLREIQTQTGPWDPQEKAEWQSIWAALLEGYEDSVEDLTRLSEGELLEYESHEDIQHADRTSTAKRAATNTLQTRNISTDLTLVRQQPFGNTEELLNIREYFVNRNKNKNKDHYREVTQSH
jgi:hypothetical protein